MAQTIDTNSEVTLATEDQVAKALRVRCDVSDLTGATFYLYTQSADVLLSGNLRLEIGREGVLWLPSDLVPEPEPATASGDEAGTASEVVEAKDREISVLQAKVENLERTIEESPMEVEGSPDAASQEEELDRLRSERQSFEGASELLDHIFSETLSKMSVAKLESLQAEEFLPQIEGKKTDRVNQLEKHYKGQPVGERARMVARAREASEG